MLIKKSVKTKKIKSNTNSVRNLIHGIIFQVIRAPPRNIEPPAYDPLGIRLSQDNGSFLDRMSPNTLNQMEVCIFYHSLSDFV